MSQNVIMHYAATNAAQTQAQNNADADVRDLAARVYPLFSSHLSQAIQIYQSIQPSFPYAAAQSGTTEILEANLGVQRAADAAVLAYAQRMLADHTTANSQLMQLATQKNVVLPKVLPAEAVLTFQSLWPLRDGNFDCAYMNFNVDAHSMALTLFGENARTAQDPDFRTYAATVQPVLNLHLAEARNLRNQLHTGSCAISIGTSTPGADTTTIGGTTTTRPRTSTTAASTTTSTGGATTSTTGATTSSTGGGTTTTTTATTTTTTVTPT
jgi:putative membrane protein